MESGTISPGPQQSSFPAGEAPEQIPVGSRALVSAFGSSVAKACSPQQRPETMVVAGQGTAVVSWSEQEPLPCAQVAGPDHDVVSPGSQQAQQAATAFDSDNRSGNDNRSGSENRSMARSAFGCIRPLADRTGLCVETVICDAARSRDGSTMAVYRGGILTMFSKNTAGGWALLWPLPEPEAREVPPPEPALSGAGTPAGRCPAVLYDSEGAAPVTMLFNHDGQHFLLEDSCGLSLYQRMGETWMRWCIPADSGLSAKGGAAFAPSGQWMAVCREGVAMHPAGYPVPALGIALWQQVAGWGWQARVSVPRPLPPGWNASCRLTMVFSPDGQLLAFPESRDRSGCQFQVCVLSATSEPAWRVPVILPFEPLPGLPAQESVSARIEVLMFSCSGNALAAAAVDGVHYWKKDAHEGWQTCARMANPQRQRRWPARIVFCINGIPCCPNCDSGSPVHRDGHQGS
ncbi:MAG: hypothetical protein OXC07_03155 [Kistimonas sp.]|nr:hypothetical protein [Kistimonas sp.]